MRAAKPRSGSEGMWESMLAVKTVGVKRRKDVRKG